MQEPKVLSIEEWKVLGGRRICITFQLKNGDQGYIEFTITPDGRIKNVEGGGFWDVWEIDGKKVKVY